MRIGWIVIMGVAAACGAKQEQVAAPEKQINSCEDAIASVTKLPRKSEAVCMRVLKITRQPPAADGKVLVVGKLVAGPTLEDPAGTAEAKPIKIQKDGAFHDDCPVGAFVEVEGKLTAESGLVEARIVRVLDDWHKSSCAADEGTAPVTAVAAGLPQAFDRSVAGTALAAADPEMKKKCKTPGVPTAQGHVKVTFMIDGSVVHVDVDTPPFAGTKTAKCIEELYKASVHVAPFSSEGTTEGGITVSRPFTL